MASEFHAAISYLPPDPTDSTPYLQVDLRCKMGSTTISFQPEEPEQILKVDVSAPQGDLSWDTSNGTCSITWKNGIVYITVAKYGDGQGGELTVSAPITDSFFTALREWKEEAQKIMQ